MPGDKQGFDYKFTVAFHWATDSRSSNELSVGRSMPDATNLATMPG